MITCILAIGDQDNWMVLQRPEPDRENDWILDWLHDDEYNQCICDNDITSMKPGVYQVDYDPTNKDKRYFVNIKLLWGLPEGECECDLYK